MIRTTAHRRYRNAMLGCVALVLLLALAACGGGGNDSGSSDLATKDASGATAEAAAGGDVADVGGAGGASRPNQAPPGEPLDGERSIISVASLRVRVADRSKAADQVVAITEGAGGFVFSRAAQFDRDGLSTFELKVPPDKFEKVLKDLGALGTALDTDQSAQDVTDQVVDLQGRLATARASADRLRALLGEAADVQGVVAIEGELTRRESEIESMEGRLRVLTSEVDDATINLTLTEKGKPKVDNDIPGFASGLRSGWVAFRNVLAVVVAVVGFLLPFLLIAVPLAILVRWRWRKRPTRAPESSATPVWYGPQFPGGPWPPQPGGPNPGVGPDPAAASGSTITDEQPVVDEPGDPDV